MLTIVPEESTGRDERTGGDGDWAAVSLIDQIVRDGARRMLAGAVPGEVDASLAQFSAERDASGRRLVVRNGVPPAPRGPHQRRGG